MTLTHLPITGLPAGQVSKLAIVCGDPARADHIAGQLDNATLLSHKREYRAHNGSYRGTAITVCSHGVGAPGAAIAFEELIVAGAQTLIRVGTCGGLQSDIRSGALVIATAAVQNTGYGRETVPDGYPAVADPSVVLALRRAAASNAQMAHSGIVLTRDNFYAGVDGPAGVDYRVMSKARVLAVEMECAALFLVGSLRAVPTAAILVADGNVLESAESVDTYNPHQETVRTSINSAIQCALEALCSLA